VFHNSKVSLLNLSRLASFLTAFGDAALMGKATGASPSLVLPKLKGGFKPDTGALLSGIRSDSVGPCAILKKVVR
jgi:hypothetical protein